MIDVLTAPNINDAKYISVFLAGGITGCPNWQKEVIKNLEAEDISVYNPRQEHFNVTDKSASYKQIVWEYERLEKSDIFSMYFCGGSSIQPICMYELGRNIVRMQNRFPSDWENRIVVSVEDGYQRAQDVIIQVELCSGIRVNTNANPQSHAQKIKMAKMEVEHETD